MGISDNSDTISGGKAKFLHEVSEDRKVATVTYTFRAPALGHNGALASVHLCYLFAGSSAYTRIGNFEVSVAAPPEFAPGWARMHGGGEDPIEIWRAMRQEPMAEGWGS